MTLAVILYLFWGIGVFAWPVRVNGIPWIFVVPFENFLRGWKISW